MRADVGSSEEGPWLARIPIAPTVRGTWAADLPIDGLPLGGYVVELHAGGGIASSTYLAVGEIRKPAYQIEVQTDRRAVIAGDPVAITGRAIFFDGTPAAGLDLQVHGFEQSVAATTDAEGRVAVTIEARSSSDLGDYGFIDISPVNPEEGEIAGSATVYVFPSAAWITASGTVTAGRVEIGGTVRRVDLDRAEQALAEGGWPDDPAGAPIAGTTVTVRARSGRPTTTSRRRSSRSSSTPPERSPSGRTQPRRGPMARSPSPSRRRTRTAATRRRSAPATTRAVRPGRSSTRPRRTS
jgi:hypothetical protein